MTRKVPKAVRAWAIMEDGYIPELFHSRASAREWKRETGHGWTARVSVVVPVLIQPIARKSGGRRK